jgi:cell division GTPase FtsZ
LKEETSKLMEKVKIACVGNMGQTVLDRILQSGIYPVEEFVAGSGDDERALRHPEREVRFILVIGEKSEEAYQAVCMSAKETGALVFAVATAALGPYKTDALGNIAGAVIQVPENIPDMTTEEAVFRITGALLEIVFKPGVVNVDFEDLKTISRSRPSMISVGVGEGHGPERNFNSVHNAFEMMEYMEGAECVLFNVTSGLDTGLNDLKEIADIVLNVCDKDVNCIWGHIYEPEMKDCVKIAIIAGWFGE